MSHYARNQACRRPLSGWPFCLFILFFLLWAPWDATGQEQGYNASFHNIPLGEALKQVAEESQIPLVYSTDLVSPHKTDCVIASPQFEDLLRCILKQSNLGYIQLSSGAYVIKEKEIPEPRYGYFAGTVIDQERRIPIPDAHVLVSNEHGKLGSTTNNAGQFIFPKMLAGNYTVSTSHIGYENWQGSIIVLPEQDIQHDILLEPESILIAPIVIDGLQNRRHIERLENEELRAEDDFAGGAARNPVALLKRAETLTGVSVNDATADIHLQGSRTGAHQLRLNGAPIFLPRNAVGIISPISTFALSKLTIHKAGYGVNLGSQTAGVIQGEYKLDMANQLAVQLDQHSLNLRLQRYAIPNKEGSATFMLALRQSMWNVYPPPELKNTISNWGAPDLFQFSAPGRIYVFATENILEQQSSQLHPDLSFNYFDLHGATRIRLNAQETLTASYYAGRTELDSGDTQFLTAPPLSVGISSRDKYTWRYNVGQIRYNYMLSSRSLLSGQFRYSETTIDHGYGAIATMMNAENAPIEDTDVFFDPRGENLDDSNRISELGGEVSLDFALHTHHVQVGLETAITQSRFRLILFRMLEQQPSSFSILDSVAVFVAPYINLNRSESERIAFFVQDTITLGANWEANVGVRTTLFHHKLYSEPRLSLRYDRFSTPDKALSFKTSIGIYRQFINQADISTLNSFKLLPTTRIWFPLDRTVRPPHTTLISQAVVWKPRASLTLRLEGYIDVDGEELVMNYQTTPDVFDIENYDNNQDGIQESFPAIFPVLEREQQDFLTYATSRKHGIQAVLGWNRATFSTELQYSFSHATRKGEGLFGGQTHPVPWNEPHRASIHVNYMPPSPFSATMRMKGVWGRPWGFQRAYYDYFGSRESTRYRLNFDFGSPADHVLPPLYQLDLSVAYTHTLENAEFQFRLDLLNALNRKNVIDWRLIYDLTRSTLVKKPRYLYGAMPVIAIGARF